MPACQQLNEAIIAALRAGVPRLEIDLREATSVGIDVGRVLRPAESLARHLGVEYRTTGDCAGLP